MNTVTLVCLAIWNLLLFVTFVVIFRKELTRWLTDIDGFSREADAEWIAFLADHPELR